MGLIRFLLAFAVVNAHVGHLFGWEAISGELAVQCFFVISGFYMSLVLGKKYSLDWTGITTFYRNRFLRLAPTYWLLAIVCMIWPAMSTLPSEVIHGGVFTTMSQLPIMDAIWIGFTNLFLVAQDTLFFRAFSPDLHSFWTAVPTGGYPLNKFMLISPSWSLAIELWFYSIVPFLAGRHWRVIAVACIGSLAIRLGLASEGLSQDPWNFRFFPSEFMLFGLGMLAQRYHRAKGADVSSRTGLVALIGVLSSICFQSLVPIDAMIKHWVLVAAFVLCVPFVFQLTKDNTIDRFVGELSFPLYMCHAVVQHAVQSYFPELGDWTGPAIAGISLVLAVALNRGLEVPIERIRQRSVQKMQSATSNAKSRSAA